jgi:hypothetical protein
VSAEGLFRAGNLFATAGWLLLLVAPRWRWTQRLVMSGAWSAVLAFVYLVLVAVHLPGAAGGFGSLAEVDVLFGNPWLLLVGWIHYLAFDLLVCVLETRAAQEDGWPHLLLVPCLVVTFLLGPIGYLVFVAIRSVRRRKLSGLFA